MRNGLEPDAAISLIGGTPIPGHEALAGLALHALEVGVDADSLIATVERYARPVRGRLATLDNTDELPDWE